MLAALLVAAGVWAPAAPAAGHPFTLRRRGPRKHRLTRRQRRQVWLSQSGAAVTPGQFLAVSVATGFAGFLVFYTVSHTVVVAAVPAAAMCAVPYAYWAKQRAKKQQAQVSAWPEAIRHLLAGLQRGLTLHQGLEELAVTGPLPLRPHMARYCRLEPQVGRELALETIRADLANTAADRVLLALGLAFTKGNALVSQILDQLATEAGEDNLTQEQINTAAVMPRINMWATFAVPYLILIFLCATQPFFRSFYRSPAGYAVVAFGLVLSIAGLLIVRAINDYNSPLVEKRVFTATVTGAATPLPSPEVAR